MNIELSTRNKLLLLIGAPTTLLLAYWLLRNKDEGKNVCLIERDIVISTNRRTIFIIIDILKRKQQPQLHIIYISIYLILV